MALFQRKRVHPVNDRMVQDALAFQIEQMDIRSPAQKTMDAYQGSLDAMRRREAQLEHTLEQTKDELFQTTAIIWSLEHAMKVLQDAVPSVEVAISNPNIQQETSSHGTEQQTSEEERQHS